MPPLRISLVLMGSLKHPLDVRALTAWPSKIVALSHLGSISLLHNADGPMWEYTDHKLRELLPEPKADAGVILGLINAPLEDNFYFRRLDERTAVLSLYEMAEIVKEGNFTLEAFVLRVSYAVAVIYAALGRVTWDDIQRWTHDDIRGCLFDMCGNKSDITFSMHQPVLCAACSQQVLTKPVDPQFIPLLENELKRLKKPLYHRLAEFVKAHPILALALTSLFGLLLNILSSVLFEKLRTLWPSLSFTAKGALTQVCS